MLGAIITIEQTIPVSEDVKEAFLGSIESVVGVADPAWVVNISKHPELNDWVLIAQSGSGRSYTENLGEADQNPEAVAHILRGWHEKDSIARHAVEYQ